MVASPVADFSWPDSIYFRPGGRSKVAGHGVAQRLVWEDKIRAVENGPACEASVAAVSAVQIQLAVKGTSGIYIDNDG